MYDYLESMKDDVREAIEDRYDIEDYRGDRDGFYQELCDDLWVDDGVTGNASGSYTFNSYEAKEYVLDNVDLVIQMASEFGIDNATIGEHFTNEDWEWFDVSIRCYMLGQAISEVLDEMEEDGAFDEIDEEVEDE